ncbi:MAG TPA: FAD-binding protein, partial [Bacteroidia bacterium]|nr:FAD-binding protein [Bacteroidia bacterium]
MIHSLNLTLTPVQAFDASELRMCLCEELSIYDQQLSGYKIHKRSIDARGRNIKVHVQLEVFVDEPMPESNYKWEPRDVSKAKPVIIIGCGPAGMFAALRLIELGLKPIILERGKDVQRRRRDLAILNKEHFVNPDSNYCFGEGGAGTYSDGKLFTRSGKRGDINRILELFVAHGADETILADAHPHIGTNKLPQIIIRMRENILASGGEIHFDTRVVDFELAGNKIRSVVTEHNGKPESFSADHILLATGHSARDIFELLDRKKILIESKPFAMGVRVEHPQALIDSLQYHCRIDEVALRREFLPAAPYSLVHQVDGKGVYSFCMCPGGIIAPCATGPEQVVTNGWSPSKRNNPYANSGIVVAVDGSEMDEYKKFGAFAGLQYQKDLEKIA